MNFLIQHPHDTTLPHQYKRYWTEYHRTLGTKKLHSNYDLIKPSDIEAKVAKSNHLVPYREWINMKDDKNILHGPFDFATVNGRKTRDKIDLRDWIILHQLQKEYHNNPPSLKDVSVNLTS